MKWLDGFNTRTREHIVSDKAAVTTCRSIRLQNKEERWNRDMLHGIFGNLRSMQDGRVEVDRNPAAPARTLPMVNPGVVAGTTTAKSRNEDNGRRICITKKMVSEFGATSGCKGCLEIGQPHTEECRAKITAKMEQDPAHAKRLEQHDQEGHAGPDNLLLEEAATNVHKRAPQDAAEARQESASTGVSSRSTKGYDVEVGPTASGRRPVGPGGHDDMDCGLDVSDELRRPIPQHNDRGTTLA